MVIAFTDPQNPKNQRKTYGFSICGVNEPITIRFSWVFGFFGFWSMYGVGEHDDPLAGGACRCSKTQKTKKPKKNVWLLLSLTQKTQKT